MAGSMLARTLRRGAPLGALAAAALLALAPPAALAKSKHAKHKAAPTVSFYVVKSTKVKCKAHYTKQTVTLRVRRHSAWAHVHQIRCVYTGNGAGGAGGVPTFPINLPTAGITVTAIPTAAADNYYTLANQPVSVGSAGGVLANDTGLGLTAAVVSTPAHGTLALQRDGAFTYTPAAGYSGIDHFSYHATSSGGESSGAAQVTLHVTPIALAPAIQSVGSQPTLNVGAPGLLEGAIGSNLHAELVSGAAHGSVTVNPDGSFSYVASGTFTGIDSFQFDVVDGDGQVSAPVTVDVSVGASPPSIVNPTFSGAVGNATFQVGGNRGSGPEPEVYEAGANALANDSDPDGGGALYTTNSTITTARGGTVTLSSDGSFTYEPPSGFGGPSDSFTYVVYTQEGASAQATATIDFGARIWYVNQSAPGGGDGSWAAPFNSLSSVSYPGAHSAAGDIVYLFGGTYSGGIVLAPSETLVGAPAGLVVNSQQLLAPSGSNPVIQNTGGVGITLSNADSLSAVTVNSTAGDAISATNANTFTIANSVSVTGAGADGIHISGGGGDAFVGAPVSGAADHAVEVDSRTSGKITFNGAITDRGEGVLLNGNPGATIDFTAKIDAATNNANPAFAALGGGTVDAPSTQNTLSALAAPALKVDSTTIGTGGLDFQSVSSGTSPSVGPIDGVFLSNTGAGAVSIAGGTIQGTSDAAITATNTNDLSLSGMTLDPATTGDGVSATTVGTLSVSGLEIDGGDMGIAASGAGASFDIENNTLSDQSATAISLAYSGNVAGALVTNHIGSVSLTGSTLGDGIDISPTVSGTTMSAQLTNNTIDNIDDGYGINAEVPSNTQLDLILTGNDVHMDSTTSQNGIEVASSGAACLDPTNNTVIAAGVPGANGMEIDQSAGTFDLRGYTSGDPAAFLNSAPNILSATGGGAGAAASGSFTPSTGTCSGYTGGE